MSSHPVSSHTANAAKPRAKSRFWAALQSFGNDMWQSYLRHSQYQIMLAGGREHGVVDRIVRERLMKRRG